MADSSGKPRPSRRWGLSTLTTDHASVAAAVLAIGISYWSTVIANDSKKIAEEAQASQVEQLRRNQASQVLLFRDNSLLPEDAPWTPEAYSDMFVRNYSRLPIADSQIYIKWQDSEESTFYAYDLGPLAPCRQYPIAEIMSDAVVRGAAANPDASTYVINLEVGFYDATGQSWVRGQNGPVMQESDSELFPSGWVEYTLGPALLVESEPIPECTPG